jgi:hypothetical protein
MLATASKLDNSILDAGYWIADSLGAGRLALPRERGRVRVIEALSRACGAQTPHLIPLPLPKGRGGN